jgi:flagellar basal-body rod protein FlgC
MNLIAENIANSSTTKTEDGTPYKKKYLLITQEPQTFTQNLEMENQSMRMAVSDPSHFAMSPVPELHQDETTDVEGLKSEVRTDSTPGDTVYMPDHPDADKDGYVHMPNVNTITEMVDMISASRSFEANITAINTAKQMAKDALEI